MRIDENNFIRAQFANKDYFDKQPKFWNDVPYIPTNQDNQNLITIKQAATERSDKDLALWHEWNNNKSPETLMPLMKAVEPIAKLESNKWLQSGMNPIILKAKAKSLAFEALKSYDPTKGNQLNTHVTNNLKQMSRFVINNQNAVRSPEEHVYDYRNQLKAKEELSQELGRDATDIDLKESYGEHGKLSTYMPLVEKFYAQESEGGGAPVMQELTMEAVGLHSLFKKLNERQQFIFQHTYGYQGADVLQNKQIAKKLKISEPAVTKHKKKIEGMYRDYTGSMNSLMG